MTRRIFSKILSIVVITVGALLVVAMTVIGYSVVFQRTHTAAAPVEARQEDGHIIVHNRQYSYSLQLPAGWKESAPLTTAYQGFFDPRAQEQHVDGGVLQGIKLELYIEQDTSITLDAFVEQKLRTEKCTGAGERYVIHDIDAMRVVCRTFGFSIVTLFKNHGVFFTIIAWIPEEDRQNYYSKIYSSIVESIRFD